MFALYIADPPMCLICVRGSDSQGSLLSSLNRYRRQKTALRAGFAEIEQVMRLWPDPLVAELRRLAPEISVNGGSFAHWLPPPAAVFPANRGKLLQQARREATGTCLIELLSNAGLPAIEPGRLASGVRNWPTGYTGSVCHKGTKVVAALAPIGDVKSLGIDIETRDGAAELSGVGGLTVADEVPPGSEGAGPVILFSVKEAVYKALHPVLDRSLGFDDVAVSWTDVRLSGLRGHACGGGVGLDIRCSTAIPRWVVSVALVSS